MQLLRLPDVLARTGMSRSRLYAALADRSFPQPVKISLRAVAWPAEEVDDWISQRIAARETAAAA